MQVAAGVRRLTNGVSNFYLLEEGGKFTLVDAGRPADWRLLLRELGELNKSVNEVEAVLLTHAHSDHTGFAERARSEAKARVWVHSEDAKVARGGNVGKRDSGMGPYFLKAETYRTIVILLMGGAMRMVPVKEVSTFSDGEDIDVPGRPRAVHVPGHTPGNSALWLSDKAVLFSGDALVTHNPLTGRLGPQIMPSGFNTSTHKALESLGKLEPLAVGIVLPGHGEPWRQGAAEAVRLARAAGPS